MTCEEFILRMFLFITSQHRFNTIDTAFSSRSSYMVVLHLYIHHQSNSDKWWSKMTHITRWNDTNYTMKCHTLPHKMMQKIFWSIDNHISFSSNQQNKAQQVYLFFHRKKAYIRLCSHNISPINIICFLLKKTNNCYDTSHNCMKIKPWLQAFYDKKKGKQAHIMP